MFDHVTIRASDRAASERFLDVVLPIVGIEKSYADEWFVEWGDFSLAPASEEKPVTRRAHIGFGAPSREHVDRFWQAGVDAGHRSDGEPGVRPQYGNDYYGGFLLDPDGNSIEAVHFDSVRPGIDHVWFRVADVAAAREFYAAVAEHAGFRRSKASGRAQFVADPGSFSAVPGDEPTENLHMAFPVADNATVQAFHRSLVGAGYRDNGPPGERPIYHEGYYAAFVLDPDGNNVELVNHNR